MIKSILLTWVVIVVVAAVLWGTTADAQLRCIKHEVGAGSLVDRAACVVIKISG